MYIWLVIKLIGDNWDVGDGRVQELFHGDEMEEGAQVHRVQDWWRVKIGDRRQGGWAWRKLRRSSRLSSQRRLPIRCLWFRFCHRGQVPEIQDLLHRMVRLFSSPTQKHTAQHSTPTFHIGFFFFKCFVRICSKLRLLSPIWHKFHFVT